MHGGAIQEACAFSGGAMAMKKFATILSFAAGVLLLAASAFAQISDLQGEGRAVVTVLPSRPDGQEAQVSLRDVQIKVNGKPANVTGWTRLSGDTARTELVLLIDGAARSSLGLQLGEIESFINEVPAHTKIAVAYMQNGRAVIASPLSADPAAVLRGLHLPANVAGGNGSPYFCLSDLAKHWPSQDRGARRVAVMITDGVDEYEMRYDPEDPYVHAAILDAVRAHLAVYSMYWSNRGPVDRSPYEDNAGQSLLAQLTEATGGFSYWQGPGNPVSFQPYFENLRSRLRHQYALTFSAPLDHKPGIRSLQVKVAVPSTKVNAPRQVYVSAAQALG